MSMPSLTVPPVAAAPPATLFGLAPADLAVRLAAGLAQGFFVQANLRGFLADPQRFSLLMITISETITLLAVLLPRGARRRDASLWAILTIPPTYAYGLLLHIMPPPDAMRELAASGLALLGLLWLIAGKITLGRSFGLLPADRGLVTRGVYRTVRHPIYLGYMVTHVGFLIGNPSVRNAIVLLALHSVQIVRILREEALLARNPEYQDYRALVRWRLMPLVF